MMLSRLHACGVMLLLVSDVAVSLRVICIYNACTLRFLWTVCAIELIGNL